MEKIKRLKITPIFESAIYEGNANMIKSVSVGANIEIKKGSASSSLFLESTPTGAAKYVKTEDKDLEIPVLQNELAGIVGDFDAKVHALMIQYGYEWVNPAEKTEPIEESAVVESAGNPIETWIGDFFVSNVISISKFVDAAAEQYDFDDQALENKFRAKVKEIIKDVVGEMYSPENDSPEAITDCITTLLADYTDDLSEFEDYRTR